jgi:hypothetical protein
MKRDLRYSVLGLLCIPLFSTPRVLADVLDVPAEYPGIATAIAAASYGDTVLVQEESYYTGYDVDVPTGITILAAGDRDHTIWNISGGLRFRDDPEMPGPSIIQGFHLELETAVPGGGITVYNPLTVIVDNYIEDIWPGDGGDAIGCMVSARIERNIIVPGSYGVWIGWNAGSTIVRRNLFMQCPYNPYRVAMYISSSPNPADTVLVYGNTFGYLAGEVEVFFSSTPGRTTNVRFVNNIFDAVGSPAWIQCTGAVTSGVVEVRYNLFYLEDYAILDCDEVLVLGPGNIFGESAQFCADWCEDYRLEPTSPAIGSGENGTTMGAYDEICGIIEVPEPPTPGGALEAGPPYPNPATSAVTLPVTGIDGGAVVLRVFDGSGRLIRTIETIVEGGVIHWDGRDGRRRSVESGVYFLDLRRGDGGAITHQRVRILR